MKVVAFNASPRPTGNTHMMLRYVLEELENQGVETEMIHVGTRNIHGCIACNKCKEQNIGKCIYNDDIVNTCIDKIKESDGIILGSPVYFGDVSSQMKAFIDRVGYATRPLNLLKGKLAASVAVHRRDGALATFNAMNNLFTISQSIIVGSSYWNHGVGGKAGDVKNDKEGIQTMKQLAINMADLLKKVKG